MRDSLVARFRALQDTGELAAWCTHRLTCEYAPKLHVERWDAALALWARVNGHHESTDASADASAADASATSTDASAA